MTKKELQEYYWVRRNIKHLENRLEELRAIAERETTQTSQERMAVSGVSDRVGNAVADMVVVQQEIQEQLNKSFRLLIKIEKAVAVLPAREGYLIRARYVDAMTWEQIAVDMGYSWQHIHKIHSEALKMLA